MYPNLFYYLSYSISATWSNSGTGIILYSCLFIEIVLLISIVYLDCFRSRYIG